MQVDVELAPDIDRDPDRTQTCGPADDPRAYESTKSAVDTTGDRRDSRLDGGDPRRAIVRNLKPHSIYPAYPSTATIDDLRIQQIVDKIHRTLDRGFHEPLTN